MAQLIRKWEISLPQQAQRDLDVLPVMRGRVPASGNLAFIEAAVLQSGGEPVLEQLTDHHRHSRRDKQVIPTCHFSDHQHGGNGHPGSRTEDCSHSHDDEDGGG